MTCILTINGRSIGHTAFPRLSEEQDAWLFRCGGFTVTVPRSQIESWKDIVDTVADEEYWYVDIQSINEFERR